MNKLTSLLLTVVIAVAATLISIFYWKFSVIAGDYNAAFSSSIAPFIIVTATLIGFYFHAKKTSFKKIAVSFFCCTIAVAFLLSIGLAMLNLGIFKYTYREFSYSTNSAAANSKYIKNKTVCGTHDISKAYTDLAYWPNPIDGKYYAEVLCISSIYKTDKVLLTKNVIGEFKESLKIYDSLPNKKQVQNATTKK